MTVLHLGTLIRYFPLNPFRAGLFVFYFLLFTVSVVNAEQNQIHDLDSVSEQPIGNIAYYLQESDQPLNFSQILDAHEQNRFIQGHSRVLTFGIGASPVWITLAVKNNGEHDKHRKLLVDTSWLDEIQIYIRHRDTGRLQQYHTGDNHLFSTRPEAKRTFQFDVLLLPGVSDIFLKVATPDPMVIPIYLLNEDAANKRSLKFQYSYGFGYGYLLALLAYNAMLFFGLRDLRYLLYAIFLSAFTIMNISYTGHGFMWIWPELVEWQRWAQPTLMILYGSTGLIFALHFLDIKKYSSRMYYFINYFMSAIITLFIFTVIFNNQTLALFTSFGFISVFVLLMLILGVVGVIHGNPSARYFLLAVFAGIIGAALTTASTWGFIPFNNWTFRAVEIGMLVEATLLALALAYRFRYVEEQQLKAEKLAQIDPLTELNNRRSFYDKAINVWGTAKRYNRMPSVILFDIDDFKALNDNFGHVCGDNALTETGKLLLSSIRTGDIVARWGGEEFILLLPESHLQDAAAFAERLREKIAALNLNCGDQAPHFTASFGVTQRTQQDVSIDALIERADKALYEAKSKGKNQVVLYS